MDLEKIGRAIPDGETIFCCFLAALWTVYWVVILRIIIRNCWYIWTH